MRCNRKNSLIVVGILGALGLILLVLPLFEVEDPFWSGMGTGMIAVAAIRLVRYLRRRKDADYWEQAEVEAKDERNRFLAGQAWAWAGYAFVFIAIAAGLAFYVAGRAEWMQLCMGGACLIMVLYSVFYLILKRKY